MLRSTLPGTLLLGTLAVVVPSLVSGQVIPLGDGEVGLPLLAADQAHGATFVPLRGAAEDVLVAGAFVFDGKEPSPGFDFVTDRFHDTPAPTLISFVPGAFTEVQPLPPAADRIRNATGDGDVVAFLGAHDGSGPDLMTLQLRTFDGAGTMVAGATLADVPTFFPDPFLGRPALAVVPEGRVVVAYTEEVDEVEVFSRVMFQRFDTTTGTPDGAAFEIFENHTNPALGRLEPEIPGDVFLAVAVDLGLGNLLARTVNYEGGPPVLGPLEGPVNTQLGAGINVNPVIAVEPGTSRFVIAWEHQGGPLRGSDPSSIRARRSGGESAFEPEEVILTPPSSDSPATPSIAISPDGYLVAIWADAVAGAGAEILGRIFDPSGELVGDTFVVNPDPTGNQLRPTVRILPERDGEARETFAVTWLDLASDGTRTGYRCFAIDDPARIFGDGFESGDVARWSP